MPALIGPAVMAGTAIFNAVNKPSGSGAPVAAPPSIQSPSITAQTPQTEQNSTAAPTYDPTAQMNKWTSIFAGMNQISGSNDISIPQPIDPPPNIKV